MSQLDHEEYLRRLIEIINNGSKPTTVGFLTLRTDKLNEDWYRLHEVQEDGTDMVVVSGRSYRGPLYTRIVLAMDKHGSRDKIAEVKAALSLNWVVTVPSNRPEEVFRCDPIVNTSDFYGEMYDATVDMCKAQNSQFHPGMVNWASKCPAFKTFDEAKSYTLDLMSAVNEMWEKRPDKTKVLPRSMMVMGGGISTGYDHSNMMRAILEGISEDTHGNGQYDDKEHNVLYKTMYDEFNSHYDRRGTGAGFDFEQARINWDLDNAWMEKYCPPE